MLRFPMRQLQWVTVRFALLAVVGAMALAACGQPAAPQPTVVAATPGTGSTPPASGAVEDLADLVAALQAAGATVKTGAAVEQEFFPVAGKVIEINGVEVQVFEFADEATRRAASSVISPEGQPSPTMMITWVDQPNFWAAGRLIVLYLGTDATIIDLLSDALGAPIAQGAGSGGNLPPVDQLPAVQAAIAALASRLSLANDAIRVVSATEVEWPDSCLGLGGPTESCLQVITPGYTIVLAAGGTEYEVHTNSSGTSVRIK